MDYTIYVVYVLGVLTIPSLIGVVQLYNKILKPILDEVKEKEKKKN